MRNERTILLATALGLAAGCATNPVTGEREFSLISESQEIQMGQQAAQEVEQSLGLVDDPALQQYVSRVGLAMAKASERPNLPWRFGVVEDASPNAFALPGGFIYVTRGLLALMENEAELASVLGHEIGHVTARHSVSQMSRAQIAQLGLGVGMILLPELAGLGELAGTGLGLLFLKFGRDDERQSDDLGFRYAYEQGYDVREMADVFEALARFGDAAGGSPIPGWLSTHPDPGDRVEDVHRRVAALNQPLDNANIRAPEYNQRIDGLVYGENPRNGFFESGWFLHPDLRFRLRFPQGWQTQNLPQAVYAVSPQEDAIVQMTLTQGPHGTAARNFLGQEGIQAGQISTERINGSPASLAPFQANTQQGTVRGVVAFIDYGGNTYQILGYAASQSASAYERTLLDAMRSFAELTDSRALAVQPNRIDAVRLDRSTTLADFNRSNPSVIPIERLAIINQVPGATATIPGGRYVKRIVGG